MSHHLIYSASAIRRVLNLPSTARLQVQKWFRVIWVWVEGQRPTFLSKATLKRHFVEWRKAAAKALFVEHFYDNIYYVSHPGEARSRRQVQVSHDGLKCQCEDFQAQVKEIGRGCCKHCYSILNYLGYDSLATYLSR